MKAAANKIRFGVIGCGMIAYWVHLRVLKRLPGARLVAAADPDAFARKRAERLAGIPVHQDAAELLARSDVDAVVVSAPPFLHAELGIAAARARKHLYIEKPIAINVADARRLLEAIRESGVCAAVGFNRRSHPLCMQTRDLIRSGVLGAIRSVSSSLNAPLAPEEMPPWKRARATGGSVLLDLASHHIDLLRWILGDEVAEVDAQIHSRKTEHDEAWTRVTMCGGVVAQSYFSFCAGRADYLDFIGERGTLRVDRYRASLSLRLPRRFGYGMRSVFLRPRRDVLAYRIVRLARPAHEPSYGIALTDLARVIHGASSRGAGMDDGLRSLEVVLAAEESSRHGRPIAVPHDSP